MKNFDLFKSARLVFFAGEKPGDGSVENAPKGNEAETVSLEARRRRYAARKAMESSIRMEAMSSQPKLTENEKKEQERTYNKEEMESTAKEYEKLKNASRIAREMYWAKEAGYFKENPGKTISKLFDQRTERGFRSMNDAITELHDLHGRSQSEFMGTWKKKKGVIEKAYGKDAYTGISKAFHLIKQFEQAKVEDANLTRAIDKGKVMYSKQYEVDKYYKSNAKLAEFVSKRPQTANDIRNQFYELMRSQSNADGVKALDTEKELLRLAGLLEGSEEKKTEKPKSLIDSLDNPIAMELKKIRAEMKQEGRNVRATIKANEAVYKRISERGLSDPKDAQSLEIAMNQIVKGKEKLQKLTNDYNKIYRESQVRDNLRLESPAYLLALMGEMIQMAGKFTQTPEEARGEAEDKKKDGDAVISSNNLANIKFNTIKTLNDDIVKELDRIMQGL